MSLRDQVVASFSDRTARLMTLCFLNIRKGVLSDDDDQDKRAFSVMTMTKIKLLGVLSDDDDQDKMCRS